MTYFQYTKNNWYVHHKEIRAVMGPLPGILRTFWPRGMEHDTRDVQSGAREEAYWIAVKDIFEVPSMLEAINACLNQSLFPQVFWLTEQTDSADSCFIKFLLSYFNLFWVILEKTLIYCSKTHIVWSIWYKKIYFVKFLQVHSKKL